MDDAPPTVESPPPAPPEPQAGLLIGKRWRLESKIIDGGMGSVWRAVDERLDELACVKLIKPHLLQSQLAQDRFTREARAASRLRGPNVVSILDFAIDEDLRIPYIAMELLRGEPLGARLQRGPLGHLATGTLLSDVCSVVSRAHELGMVHRDLKPANIFLTPHEDGFISTVLDFGIVKAIGPEIITLTDTNAAVGTPNYMSPEQFEDARNVDHRADLWALTIIAYECMTGCAAYVGDSPLQLAVQIREKSPTAPSAYAKVPKGFDEWILRGTARSIDERFQSAEELLDSFRALGASAVASPPAPKPKEAPRTHSWASDANQIDIDRLEEVTFESTLVREFLDDPNRYFVSGAKGCGKTLLLTHKRARLHARYKSEGHAKVQFIPEGRPYLDLMSDLGTLSKASIELMSRVAQTKRLWSFALKLSAISHAADATIDSDAIASWPARLRDVAEGRATEPTVIVRELLSLTPAQLHATLAQAEMPLEHAVRGIHSGMYFFIDKIDQAMRGVTRDAWIAMQAGMVEAAWDLVNTNAHLKVYATIREEAFSSYESDIKSNLYGATTNIRYGKQDLRAILEHLTAFYEGIPLRDFVSVDVVHAPSAAQTEGAFDFMHRHSLGRPRDLVIVASEISRNRGQLDERRFKRVVHETSAGIIVSNVFDEMRVFLEVLADRDTRRKFFSRLPYNVLTEDDLIDAWCKYHGVGREYYDDYGKSSDDVFHPFRELFDCGLLGCVERDEVEGTRVMAFKQPHEPIDERRRDIPSSTHYLLHPTFAALVRRLGLGDEFRTMREIVVGHELPWRPHYTIVHRVQREMYRVKRAMSVEVEEAVLELLADFGREVTGGRTLIEAQVALGKSAPFARLCHELERLRLDEVHLALLEAFGPAARKHT
ncbi:MAG: serine/threonine-protein kinase [Deltaproteobacteria bacterium]